jgi:outer membrane protein assembly factor BamD (BamD/ComL family)
MKLFMVFVVALASLMASGCTGDKCKELFETAQFEEKQRNREHAVKLYEEILAKYPGCTMARQAQDRLAALRVKQ